MGNVVDFNMIVEINHLLKEHGIEYSIHSIGGCVCCGLELRQDGVESSIDNIMVIINEYLSQKWLRVVFDENNPMVLNVESKF